MEIEKVLIMDTPILRDSIRERLEWFDIVVYDAEKLTQSLIDYDLWDKIDPQYTLLVFPGNGASVVRSYLPFHWLAQWQWVSVPARRYWQPGNPPQVVVERIYSPGMLLGFRHLVIVDDVVSSGKTASMLRRLNDPWVPGVRWHVTIWIAQRSASLRGFITRQAAVWVGSNTSRASINSLSTLLQVPEVARSFGQRHLGSKKEEFLHLLKELKMLQNNSVLVY